MKTKNWMVRFDNEGLSYNNFKWNPVGEWTVCPYWNPSPVCGNGLHGQGPGGFGYSGNGSRFCFCEIDKLVVIDNNKIKTNRAKILSVNTDAFLDMLNACDNNFEGSLYLSGYDHPLPEGFTHNYKGE